MSGTHAIATPERTKQPAETAAAQSRPRPGRAAAAFALGERGRRVSRCACGGTGGHCTCDDEPRALVERTLRGPGHPLDTATHAAMSNYFGRGFSGVRVHTGADADTSSRAIDALAYTVGQDVVFSNGAYAPHTASGRRLLTHELTHVVQQDGAPAASGSLEVDWNASSPAEVEAGAAAEGIGTERSAPQVARQKIRRVQRSEGSPAGGCGVCMGPQNAGSLAHDIIQGYMEEMYGRAIFPEVYVPSPTDENGYLDLLTATPTGFAIGEIKPANFAGYLQGDLDLFWYEDQMDGFGFTVDRMNLPPPLMSMMFQDPLAIGCPQELFVNPPVHGIYTYFCEPDFAELVGTCECMEEEPDEQPQEQPQDQPQDQPLPVSPTSPIPFIPPVVVPPVEVPPEEVVPEVVEGLEAGEAVEEGLTIWELLELAPLLAL